MSLGGSIKDVSVPKPIVLSNLVVAFFHVLATRSTGDRFFIRFESINEVETFLKRMLRTTNCAVQFSRFEPFENQSVALSTGPRHAAI